LFPNFRAAHLLGPGLALPLEDANAEKFAESMYHRIELSEKDILAVADLPPLENATLSLLQEVLCKLSISVLGFTKFSTPFLSLSAKISACSLFPVFLHHR